MMKTTNAAWRWLALLLVFGLIAAACGDDDDDAASDTEAAAEGEADTSDEAPAEEAEAPADADEEAEAPAEGDDPTAGCAENGLTDPSDLSPDRTIARCESGYPQPQPLEERQTIKLGNRFRAEFVAPILLAEHYGLFDEENIDVEWEEISLTDSMVPLDDCSIDFAIGGTEASFHNGIAQGLDVRQVLGNFFPPDAGNPDIPQTGLWVRRDVFSDPDNPDINELKGVRVGSAVGLGSVVVYPMAQAFADAGFSLLDMEFEQIAAGEQFIALQNNAVQAAWMLDPFWSEAAADPENYVLLVTQTPGEPLGGVYAGPCVRSGDRMEAGQAFIRAYIRAVNTYLPPNYIEDADVVAALAEEMGAPVESIVDTGWLYFDWEVRDTTSPNAQQFFIEFDTVEYDEVLPDDQVVDRSMYEAVVGG